MVVTVANNALKSGAQEVVVATDDQRIAEVVENHHHKFVMTSKDHESGTDRVAEAANKIKLRNDAIVVNVQGDEPELDPLLIRDLANFLEIKPHLDVATTCKVIKDVQAYTNPNVVKVILKKDETVAYFSRSPIPHIRDSENRFSQMKSEKIIGYQHMGIYAFRKNLLNQFSIMEKPKIEEIEKLEQLRLIWNGYAMGCLISSRECGPSIDTPDDLEDLEKKYLNLRTQIKGNS